MKLKLSDIRKTLTFKVQTTMLHYLSSMAEGRYNYTIDYDVYLPSIGKNLQRDFCWNIEQKQELVISVLKGIRIAPIAVIQHTAENGQRTLKIIDGKQRLSTIISFYKGEFPIVFNNQEFYYKDLEEDAQRAISLFQVEATMAYEYWDDMISDKQKIAWFEMINFAGTPQDVEHLKNLM